MGELSVVYAYAVIPKGALTLASAEVRFQIDSETADPLAVEMYQVKDTNKLVEEFMLFANITVAKKILEFYPSLALLRCHPVPPSTRFEKLIKVTKKFGVELNAESGKALADSLDAAEVAGKPYFNKVLRIMITRCISQAKYFCSGEKLPDEYHHYGLAANIYTHFTSPIRRYADVVVHRMLAAATGIEALPPAYAEKSTINDICANINKRNYAAQISGRESVAMFSRIFFKGREHIVESAIIMDCKAKGIVVLVLKYGVESFIRLVPTDSQKERGEEVSVAGATDWTFDDEEFEFHSNSADMSLTLFQQVEVRISVEEREAYREELVLELVSVQPNSTSANSNPPKRPAPKKERATDKKRARNSKKAE